MDPAKELKAAQAAATKVRMYQKRLNLAIAESRNLGVVLTINPKHTMVVSGPTDEDTPIGPITIQMTITQHV